MTRRSILTAILTALVALALSGCGSTPPKREVAPIPVGPGPMARYSVQPQPPPGSCSYGETTTAEGSLPAGQPLPDPACTPGATNPDVTQATLATTICKPGYTSTIRPPVSITNAEKRANAKSYGYSGSLSDAEFDHFIPLEVGGDPNDARNLWVQAPSPGHVSGIHNPKDPIENEAHRLVCSGRVPLLAMQQALVANWTTAIAVVEERYFHANGCVPPSCHLVGGNR